jgi:hypothetical protein
MLHSLKIKQQIQYKYTWDDIVGDFAVYTHFHEKHRSHATLLLCPQVSDCRWRTELVIDNTTLLQVCSASQGLRETCDVMRMLRCTRREIFPSSTSTVGR